jgi:uncharacterized membrane protein YjgN (DUF898 family)
MKTNFELTVEGKDWSKPFTAYWILFLIFNIPMQMGGRWMGAPGAGFLSFIFSILTVIIAAVYTIKIMQIIVPKLSIDGKAFGFGGSPGKYLKMYLGGYLLSIITLTIYIPWFAKKVAAYLASETTFDGSSPEFQGQPKKLFKYLILALLLPVIVVCVIFGAVIGFNELISGMEAPEPVYPFLGFIMFIVLIPFIYMAYKWCVNFKWKEMVIRWDTSFWPSFWMILGQVLLTIITVGIYWPAAVLKLYRYFVGKTVLVEGEAEKGRLGFEGAIGKGFGLMWGQTLLCIITIGFYIPWGYSKVAKWVLGSSYAEMN